MTYRKLSELIIDRHYNGIPSDDATVTLRHVAELVFMEVAKETTRQIKQSAIEASNAGEAFYANDQFTTVYNSLKLKSDPITKEKYVTMPAIPVTLVNNQEIASVAFTACPNVKVVPIKQKDTFAQTFLPMPSHIKNYKVENDRIVFINLHNIVTGDVSLKLVGAMPLNMILDANIDLPQDSMSVIQDAVMLKLNPRLTVQRDIINDSQALPA